MVNFLPTFLFFIEAYHTFAHSLILFGIRTIPLRDLNNVGQEQFCKTIKKKLYFYIKYLFFFLKL